MINILLLNKNIGFNGKFYTFPYFLTFLLKRIFERKIKNLIIEVIIFDCEAYNYIKTSYNKKECEAMQMIRDGMKEDSEKIARLKIDNWRKTYSKIFPEDFLNNLSLTKEKEKYLNNLKK